MRAPPASRRAIEPPPAPIVWMSRAGSRIGYPATIRDGAGSGTPPRTRQTSVLVPPMSNETASGKPHASATAAAARTPPAGPDEAAFGRHHERFARQHVEPEQVVAAHRPEGCVGDGRDNALVLPELGR